MRGNGEQEEQEEQEEEEEEMNNEEEMPCRRGCAKNRLKPENKERACEQRFFF